MRGSNPTECIHRVECCFRRDVRAWCTARQALTGTTGAQPPDAACDGVPAPASAPAPPPAPSPARPRAPPLALALPLACAPPAEPPPCAPTSDAPAIT
eukprot:802344-Pyramimonas_sp.AAC.1